MTSVDTGETLHAVLRLGTSELKEIYFLMKNIEEYIAEKTNAREQKIELRKELKLE